MTALSQQDLHDLFQSIDRELTRRRRPALRITILGGASIILLGFRERATRDIDIAPTADAHLFQKLCRPRGIPVDIVTVCSTVDLHHCATTPVFQGKRLAIQSVTIEDLIKLKLERFRKHDPEDIYAILQRSGLPFDQFQATIKEMLLDFVGNPRELALSACLVVERIYPNNLAEFEKEILPLDEEGLEDFILVEHLGIDEDAERAMSASRTGKNLSSEQLRKRFRKRRI